MLVVVSVWVVLRILVFSEVVGVSCGSDVVLVLLIKI